MTVNYILALKAKGLYSKFKWNTFIYIRHYLSNDFNKDFVKIWLYPWSRRIPHNRTRGFDCNGCVSYNHQTNFLHQSTLSNNHLVGIFSSHLVVLFILLKLNSILETLCWKKELNYFYCYFWHRFWKLLFCLFKAHLFSVEVWSLYCEFDGCFR